MFHFPRAHALDLLLILFNSAFCRVVLGQRRGARRLSILQYFFTEHLVSHKQVSPRTIVAYRDSFRLLLKFLKKRTGKQPFTLCVDVNGRDHVVRGDNQNGQRA
jgi:hypothetical protein